MKPLESDSIFKAEQSFKTAYSCVAPFQPQRRKATGSGLVITYYVIARPDPRINGVKNKWGQTPFCLLIYRTPGADKSLAGQVGSDSYPK